MELIDFDPITVNCYYGIFATIAVSSNGLLIYLVRYRSPNIVRSVKAMLINISTTQILVALTAAFLQGRIISTTSTAAILSEGPSSIFGPTTCLASYNIFSALTSYVELLIVHTMFCRYRMLQMKGMKTTEMFLSFVLVAIWPVVLLVLSQLKAASSEVVMDEAIHEHPDYNLERYGEFGGLQMTNPFQAIDMLIAFIIVTASPILILYLKRLILKTLTDYQQYTENIVQNSKMFLKALTVQAMVPILCFVPIALLGILSRVSESKIVIVEYLFLALAALPCAVDPLIAIYFVPLYRTWVLGKLRKQVIPM